MSLTTTLTHPATPPSLNRIGTRGGNHWATTRAKKTWQETWSKLLLASTLSRGLRYVEVSATLRFPVRRRRDADNHSWMLVKALGDALVSGGWIPDDTPEHFRFVGLRFEEAVGKPLTTVVLKGRR